MEARAVLRYARISPRKVKIVLDLIRNKPANVAMGILNNTPKAASEYLTKLLASAIANAENNHDMDKNKLYVAECYATQGPTLKRIQPHAQGRAFKILKRCRSVISFPSNTTLPDEAGTRPDSTLIRDDFPAPFAPIIA